MSEPSATPAHAGKVPLVSEVLDRLVAQAGTSSTPRSAMFQSALQVCTEELRHVKKGAEPASLATLVERARYLLMPPGASFHPGSPSAEPQSAHAGAADAPSPPPAAPPEPPPFVPGPHGDDAARVPGHDVAGAADADPFPLAGEHAAPDRLEVDVWPPPPPRAPFEELFAGLDPGTGAAGDPVPAPSRRARRLALAGGLVFVAAAAAAWFLGLQPRTRRAEPAAAIAESRPAPRGQDAPTAEAARALPAAAPAPAVATEPPAPPPAPPTATAAPPATPTPAPVPPRAPSAAEPPAPRRAAPAPARSRPAPPDRTAVMVSPDWAGQGPIYALHFSSYHDRDKALADAARIKSAYGQPTHVLKVDLGAEGVWYRVMAGEFASADEASSFRAELAARHVPDVAHVYRVTGPR